MTNTTDEYWEVDGQSLQTYAYNISTKGDGRDRAPDVRGTNIVIPFKPGRRYVKKVVDSRVITLRMWVRGVEADGTQGNPNNLYQDNWRKIHNLLFTPGRQFVLKKRFRVGGVLKTAVALAEYVEGLEPKMHGRFAGLVEVDLELADPWFYDETATTFTLTNGDNNITVPGSEETIKAVLEISGARKNVLVTNKGYTPNISLRYTGTLVSGDKAIIDIENFSSMTDPTGATPAYRSTSLIRHTGDPMWLRLKPGAQVINLSSETGTGTVQLTVKGAWW